MAEPYIKVHGQWVYLCRAAGKAGQTVDFILRRNRDVDAAKSFLSIAMKNTRVPTKIIMRPRTGGAGNLGAGLAGFARGSDADSAG